MYGPGVYRGNGIYNAGTTVVSLADHWEIRYDAFQGAGCILYSKSYTIIENNTTVDKEFKNSPTVNTITSGTATPDKGCGLVVDLVLADETTVKIDRVVHEHKDSPDMTACPVGSVTIFTCIGCGDSYKVTDEETFVAYAHEYKFENGAVLVGLVYENDNYLLGGTMTVKCAHCDSTTVPEEKYDALFEAVGYSMSEDDEPIKYVSHTVIVNKKAIEVYETISGKTVNYGVVGAIANDGKPLYLDNEGKLVPSEKAVAVNMTGTDYSKITIKINGLSVGIGVNCNAYVLVDGAISYICDDQILDVAVEKVIAVVEEPKE